MNPLQERLEITEGSKIYFIGEPLPMELIAKTKRYAVVVRKLDIESDFELLAFEVERGTYSDSHNAYEDLKDQPVYSLLDFEEEKRGPDNYVLGIYDYWSKEDCEQCIKDLEDGEVEISRRHGIELNIDWERTRKGISNRENK